jgi:hypothetical protein
MDVKFGSQVQCTVDVAIERPRTHAKHGTKAADAKNSAQNGPSCVTLRTMTVDLETLDTMNVDTVVGFGMLTLKVVAGHSDEHTMAIG